MEKSFELKEQPMTLRQKLINFNRNLKLMSKNEPDKKKSEEKGLFGIFFLAFLIGGIPILIRSSVVVGFALLLSGFIPSNDTFIRVVFFLFMWVVFFLTVFGPWKLFGHLDKIIEDFLHRTMRKIR